MNSSSVSDLRNQWHKMRDLAKTQVEKDNVNPEHFSEVFSEFLEKIIQEGRKISEPTDRARLQWLANEVGDAIFRIKREYPDVVILPFDSIAKGESKSSLNTDKNLIKVFDLASEINAKKQVLSTKSVHTIDTFIVLFVFSISLIFLGGVFLTRAMLTKFLQSPQPDQPIQATPSNL